MVGTSTPHRNKRVEESRDSEEIESREDSSFAKKAAIYATRPIRTEDEYDHAREIVARLLREPHEQGSLAYDVLEVLSILIEDYEDKSVPELPEASAQEVVQFMSEQRGISQGELAQIVGGRSRLSEFMNKKRRCQLVRSGACERSSVSRPIC